MALIFKLLTFYHNPGFLIVSLIVQSNILFFCSTFKARDKGVSETVIGLIFGIYPLVIFVVSPFLGYLVSYINYFLVL